MSLVKVKALADLPLNSVTELEVGDAMYAVCNIDGEIHCVDGACPHAGGPLSEGTLHGGTLVCPWHGWEFDARTGACVVGDDGIKTYPVVLKNNEVFVDLP